MVTVCVPFERNETTTGKKNKLTTIVWMTFRYVARLRSQRYTLPLSLPVARRYSKIRARNQSAITVAEISSQRVRTVRGKIEFAWITRKGRS